MPKPLEPGDELRVVHGHFAIKDEPVGVQLAKGRHKTREPTGVVPTIPAHQSDGPGDPVR
jgi:hypothetical protein